MAEHAACRFCSAPLRHTFVDLETSPLANSFLTEAELRQGETFLPLHAYVCERCFLVQLEEIEAPEHIFSDYVYFSSVSESWVRHAQAYAEATIPRFGLGAESTVVEIASNDGYLLQWFVQAGVPVLGIEPAANVAKVAEERGIPSLVEFFGSETATRLAGEGRQADLIVGNNVLAHVPALNDFVEGMQDPARARRRDHDGVPAPPPADPGDAVRHDLPRALLVPLAARSRAGLRRTRSAPLRRRGAALARRLAADLRVPRRRAARDDGAASPSSASARTPRA